MLAHIKKNKLLFFIIFLALIVRFVGIYPGHPANHPDEPMSYGSAIEMLIHNDLNPRRFDYPAGVPLLHYAFFQSIILPFLFAKLFLTSPMTYINAFLTGTNLFKDNPDILIGHNGIILLYASRFLTAMLGVLSVFLVYKISEKLFNKMTGIFSAFFLAFNYRHDLSSHLALSDIPNSFFVVLAFYSSVLLFEKNTKKRYLFAGLCVGLSFAMKYQIFALLPLLFVQLVWVFRKNKISQLWNKYFLLALIVVPLVFVVLNPYLFLNLKTAIPMIQYVGGRYGAGINKLNYYALLYLYKWGINILPFILIIVGFVLMAIRDRIKTLLLLSYVGVFLYIFLYYMSGGGYVRNFTTVIPLLMIFAGYGFYQLTLFAKLFYKKIPFFILFAILVLINFDPIRSSALLAINYSKPWVKDVLDSWVQKNIPEGSTVRNDVLSVSSNVTKKLNFVDWSHSKDDSIEEFVSAGEDFAVLNVAWHQAYMLWSDMKLKEILSYMDIPYKRLKDSYYGLSLTEFKDYSIWETYKSWQSPEDSYLVLKIPKFPKDLNNKINEFHFDSNLEGWKFYDFNGTNFIERIEWNKDEGNENAGSLEMTGNIPNLEFSRLVSPFVKIKPRKTYLIEANVNNISEIGDNSRDGFFRIDVFENNKIISLAQSPVRTAVSGRIYGLPGWKKKKILISAPSNGNYLTIGFQRAILGGQVRYFIDDISVYEIDKNPETFPNFPYKYPTIPNDLLYPIGIY